MASRINANMRWVTRRLAQEGVHDVIESEVLDALNHVERECLGESAAVRQVDVLTFTGVDAVYPAGVGRVVHVEQPTTWTDQMLITEDPEVYSKIKAENPSGGTVPLVMLIWNKNWYFWPVCTTGESITIYSQSAQAAVLVEGSGDPLLPEEWDMVLRYGALSHLLKSPNPYEAKYETERGKANHGAIQGSAVPLRMKTPFDETGF